MLSLFHVLASPSRQHGYFCNDSLTFLLHRAPPSFSANPNSIFHCFVLLYSKVQMCSCFSLSFSHSNGIKKQVNFSRPSHITHFSLSLANNVFLNKPQHFSTTFHGLGYSSFTTLIVFFLYFCRLDFRYIKNYFRYHEVWCWSKIIGYQN